jgi:hypothetical protein
LIIQHLANLPSSCPADSSSVESCISVLKSSISAFENSIKATEGSSGFWETVGWSCAFAVGLGITGEIIVIVSEHCESLEDWGRGIILPPAKPSSWRFRFAIAATIIVLVGVFGEAIATSRVAAINSLLRSKTNELRATSDRLVAVVEELAGDASISADVAKHSANAARIASGKAQQQADAASASAASVRTLVTGIKADVDLVDLILFTNSTGQMFRMGLLHAPTGRSAFRENIKVTWRTGALVNTIMFAERVSRALSSLGWQVPEPAKESERQPTALGMTIYNKWRSYGRPNPELDGIGAFSSSTFHDASGFRAAVWGDGNPGMDGQHLIMLTNFAVGLNANLVADPAMPEDSVEIVVNDAK